jgi:hypothetical protein
MKQKLAEFKLPCIRIQLLSITQSFGMARHWGFASKRAKKKCFTVYQQFI